MSIPPIFQNEFLRINVIHFPLTILNVAQLCCYASRRIPSLLRSEVHARENHTKMARFWLVCSGEIRVKSDKVALIEGKTFNVMFLVIPVVPTENWLRLTHNQSRKTFKVTALFLRPHRGSNAALACQNSRK